MLTVSLKIFIFVCFSLWTHEDFYFIIVCGKFIFCTMFTGKSLKLCCVRQCQHSDWYIIMNIEYESYGSSVKSGHGHENIIFQWLQIFYHQMTNVTRCVSLNFKFQPDPGPILFFCGIRCRWSICLVWILQ